MALTQVMERQPWSAAFFILYLHARISDHLRLVCFARCFKVCLKLRVVRYTSFSWLCHVLSIDISVYQGLSISHLLGTEVTTFAILNVMIAVIVESTLDEADSADQL